MYGIFLFFLEALLKSGKVDLSKDVKLDNPRLLVATNFPRKKRAIIHVIPDF